MPWQLLVLLGSLASAFRAIEARQFGKSKTDLTLFNLVLSLSFVVLAGFSYVVFTNGAVDSEAAWSARYYIMLMAFGIGLQNFLTLKLFRLLPASIVVLLSLLNPISVAFMASFFLEETLNSNQIIGAFFIISGVLCVELVKLSPAKKTKRITINVGLVLAVLIAFIYGVSLTTEKYLLDRIGMDTYLIYGWGAQLLAAVIISLTQYKKFKLPAKKKYYKHSILYAALLGISGLLYVSTQVQSNSATLTVIGSSSRVALAVFLAYFILNERDNLLIKITGILLSAIGMFYLFQ